MNNFKTKIHIILLAALVFFSGADFSQAATTITSPYNYSTYGTDTTVGFYWNYTSDYNYIALWDGSWGSWQALGSQTDYTGVNKAT